MSKFLFYTISSNNYHHITQMMLDSFYSVCSHPMIVLSIDQITHPYPNNFVSYITIENKNLLENINIHNIFFSRASYWLKSQILNYITYKNYDYIVFTDSDILYFTDISQYILNTESSYLYISSDDKKSNINRDKINSGFFFFNTTSLFPYEDLMYDWSNSILDIYNDSNIRFTNKLIWKYPDQTALKNLLNTNKYAQYRILCPQKFSIKYRNKDSLICHYFKKYYKTMLLDYNNLP